MSVNGSLKRARSRSSVLSVRWITTAPGVCPPARPMLKFAAAQPTQLAIRLPYRHYVATFARPRRGAARRWIGRHLLSLFALLIVFLRQHGAQLQQPAERAIPKGRAETEQDHRDQDAGDV